MLLCSWNIWSKGSLVNSQHWRKEAQFLLEKTVDVAVLQEVDRHWGDRTENVDVALEMANIMNCEHFFYPSISSESGGQYGNAILSKYPIVDSGGIYLSPQINWDKDNHETEPRAAIWIEIRQPRPTIVIGVHLANAIEFASTNITYAQAKKLEEFVRAIEKEYSNHQIVLCGDFNLEPNTREIILLSNILKRQSDTQPTWPAQPFNYKGWEELPPPRFCVDHIFANERMNTWLGDSDLSDHLPLFAKNQPR